MNARISKGGKIHHWSETPGGSWHTACDVSLRMRIRGVTPRPVYRVVDPIFDVCKSCEKRYLRYGC